MVNQFRIPEMYIEYNENHLFLLTFLRSGSQDVTHKKYYYKHI